jgi:four helix bundle protein
MEAAQSFRDLMLWQKAHALVLAIYRLTRSFPREEVYALTNQFRRAIVSVPANIAEGFVKRSTFDKLRFYNTAQGSLEECRYYLILSQDLGYSEGTDQQMQQLDEVSRMLEAYVSTIASKGKRRLYSLLFWLLAPGSWLLPVATTQH